MRSLLATLILALVAAGVWFAIGSQPAEGSPAVETPDAGTQSQPVEPRTTGREKTSTPDRAAITSSDQGPQLVVRVEHAETNEPLEGAVVRYLDSAFDLASLDAESLHTMNVDREVGYTRFGLRVTTDATGRCRIPQPTTHRIVVARFGEFYGETQHTDDHEGELVIHAHRDHTLRIKVVDAEGHPAKGLHVWGAHAPGENGRRRRMHFGRTDAEGLVVQWHSQFSASRSAKDVEVYAQAFGCESNRVWADLKAPPAEPILLRLPPTGVVVFQILESDGKPLDCRRLDWKEMVIGVFDKKPTVEESRNASHGRAELSDFGRARFGYVALGKHLSVIQHSVMDDRFHVVGPTRQGEVLEVPIKLDARDVRFVGRAVGADGKPLAGQKLRIICEKRSGMASQAGLCDDAGRFEFRVPWIKPGSEARIYATLNSGDPVWQSHLAEVPEAVDVQAGKNDLGDLAFGPGPLLLSGRVQFPASIERKRLGWTVESKRIGRRTYARAQSMTTQWQPDGRFEIRGPTLGAKTMRLRFKDTRFRPMELFEFAVGAKDVVLEAKVAASLQVDFLVDGDTPWKHFEFRLQPLDRELPTDFRERRREQRRRRLDLKRIDDGRIRTRKEGMLAGRYDVLVRCRGSRQLVTAVRGIEVRDGEPVIDERLKAVDLRGIARLIEVTLRGPGNQLVPKPAFVLSHDGPRENWFAHDVRAGVARLAITGPVDIHAFARGAALTTRRDVNADCVVQLVAATAVRFRVKPATPIPDGIEVRVLLTPSIGSRYGRGRLDYNGGSTGLSLQLRSQASLDEAGVATVLPAVPGLHDVQIELVNSNRSRSVYDVLPKSVDVGKSKEVVDVEIDAAAFAKAVKYLSERR